MVIPETTTINATDLDRDLARIARDVREGRRRVVVQRRNRDAYALLPIADYQRLLAFEALVTSTSPNRAAG